MTETIRRRRVTVDDTPLARSIGARIRQARLRAGLTQQQLAGDRYTKAYVSALENGSSKPSMAALNYLATRLDISATVLLAGEADHWSRLEGDVLLASGRWQEALDIYDRHLAEAPRGGARAELLRGRAEALARLDRGPEAAAAGSETPSWRGTGSPVASTCRATRLRRADCSRPFSRRCAPACGSNPTSTSDW